MSTYRDFKIDHPLAGPAYGYQATHVDYDGPEDDRIFHNMDVEILKCAVDLWHAEQETEAYERALLWIFKNGGSVSRKRAELALKETGAL